MKMLSDVNFLHYLLFIGASLSLLPHVSCLVVSTYNLWNVMFHWEVRKLRIVEMIEEIKPDVIAFQEVRADISGMRNQLHQLQALLPVYKWRHFHIASQVSELPRQGSYLKGWEIEGVGLLSRHPIIKSTAQTLSYKKGPDKNKRVVIHAAINVDFVGIFNIAVGHFSYDRHQQCLNAAELKKYVVEKKLENVIVLGDFNTYPDFEGPMDVLTNEKVWSKCQNVARDVLHGAKRRVLLYDAWAQCKDPNKGLTFSNMPTPGLESRPDRTFITGNMKVLSCNRSGDAVHYTKFYYNAVLWQRLKNVVHATKSAYHGKVGRTCPHDCGPRASCRCGVCVAGSNRNTCDIPDCSECSADIYKYIYIYIIVIPSLIVQFLYAAVKSIIVLKERKQAIFQAVGCYCCLCYARCPKCIAKSFRKLDHSIFIKMWPFCQLPALPLMFFTAFLLMVCIVDVMNRFSRFYHTVMMMLPEELNPSDHMMLTFEIRLLLP